MRTGWQVFGLTDSIGAWRAPMAYWPSLPKPRRAQCVMTAVVPVHRCGAVSSPTPVGARPLRPGFAPGFLLRRPIWRIGRTSCTPQYMDIDHRSTPTCSGRVAIGCANARHVSSWSGNTGRMSSWRGASATDVRFSAAARRARVPSGRTSLAPTTARTWPDLQIQAKIKKPLRVGEHSVQSETVIAATARRGDRPSQKITCLRVYVLFSCCRVLFGRPGPSVAELLDLVSGR
jgi:hypothetical protein